MSSRSRLCSVLPAFLVALASLIAPLVATGGPVAGTATSVTARAAQHDGQPAAGRFAVDGPLFQSARAVAEAHWGAAPCKGQVTVGWTTLEEGTNATATWRNPTDAWNNAPENFDCAVELNAAADYDFAKLCTVLTHELGHLHGRAHVEQPGELMSALYSEPTPACRQAAPPEQDGDPVEADDDDAAEGTAATAGTQRPAVKKRAVSRTSLRKAAVAKRRCVRAMKAGQGKSKRKAACTRTARQAKRPAAKR